MAAFFTVTENLLKTKPFQDITVAEIITRTPHSRSSFYHHFDGKVDVLVALATSVLDNAYRGPGLWDAQPGRSRARAMHASIGPTIAMWTDHGDVVGAVIEQMHTTPVVAQVWKETFDKFVTAVSAQLTQQWIHEEITFPASSATMATILVCGIERTFYVSSRGLDRRLPAPESAVEAIEWITLTAVQGRKPQNMAPAAAVFSPQPHLERAIDGTSTARAEQTDSTADSILDALRSLLLEAPLDKVSVAKITARAQVSRSTFYFYFDNKNAAFAALYRGLAEAAAAGLRRLHTIDRTNASLVETTLTEWLQIDDHAVAIMRSALHEWPRRAELRTVYREGMSAMADILESILIQDRTDGVALAGPPPDQFAAVLLWTVERSIAGALAGEDHLDDLGQVISSLSALLTSAIYGR
ncbi:TetR/AcrR family transcriptional regulator [Williamsia soli]|uniref:TetR/AcrR family transcriptional regulator n=1 Tax=Williamsia soli TaxID=364929 RepID=UPI0027DC1361|nr:TetR/AcrR family transcriptional regulator [Williamsia soli]